MDQYDRGWDPEVSNYLRKLMSSIGYGLLWMMFGVTAGLFFRLAYRKDIPVVFNILFYLILLIGLFFLGKYYRRVWLRR